MGIIIGIVIVVLALWFFAVKVAPAVGQAPWVAQYLKLQRQGLSAEDAIVAAVTTLRYRAPFNQLSDADIRAFAQEFARCKKPELFANVLFEAQTAGYVALMRDVPELRSFVDHYNATSPPQ